MRDARSDGAGAGCARATRSCDWSRRAKWPLCESAAVARARVITGCSRRRAVQWLELPVELALARQRLQVRYTVVAVADPLADVIAARRCGAGAQASARSWSLRRGQLMRSCENSTAVSQCLARDFAPTQRRTHRWLPRIARPCLSLLRESMDAGWKRRQPSLTSGDSAAFHGAPADHGRTSSRRALGSATSSATCAGATSQFLERKDGFGYFDWLDDGAPGATCADWPARAARGSTVPSGRCERAAACGIRGRGGSLNRIQEE